MASQILGASLFYKDAPISFFILSRNMNYKKLLQQSIDLHVHIGPEIIPRRFTLGELLKAEKNKLRGVAVKNHFFPTIAMDTEKTLKRKMPFVINSVTLNNYLGGFNCDIIRASAELSIRPIIVWFPTLHTNCFLKGRRFEIPKEWIGPLLRKSIKLQLTKDIKKLTILNKKNSLKKEVIEVLETIKQYKAILATGHLSWQESEKLIKYAVKIDIKKNIITHPIYPRINMPIRVKKELVRLGAYIESCFSMYLIDKVPINYIAREIKEVGAENCILSSDTGQIFSPKPSIALIKFVQLLKREGITDKEIRMMLIINPEILTRKQGRANRI